MTGTALVPIAEQWAALAKPFVNAASNGGQFISTRSGILKIGDDALPGNQMAVIIVDSLHESTFYPDEYDEAVKVSPTCYAFGRDAAELAPHESMQRDPNFFKPQHSQCQGCPQNQWGTARKGKGKACQTRRRLALVPAGFYMPRRASRDFDLDIITDPEHYRTADVAYLKLPVTSVQTWNKYISTIAVTSMRPPHGVITRIALQQHPKWQFEVTFDVIGEVDDHLAEVIMARHEQESQKQPGGYPTPAEQAQA